MIKSDKLIVHTASYITIIVGGIYGILKYFFKVQTDYGLVPHLWQSTFHHLHVFLAPFFVFALGYIWKSHIKTKLDSLETKKKFTGYTLFGAAIIMITSGYLIQTELHFKNIWVWLHIVISIIWIPFYLIHHFEKVAK